MDEEGADRSRSSSQYIIAHSDALIVWREHIANIRNFYRRFPTHFSTLNNNKKFTGK